jgi:beta-lactamase class D
MTKFTLVLLAALVLLASCTENRPSSEKNEEIIPEREIIVSGFQSIIDSAMVSGAILIYDLEDDQYYSNDFNRCKKGNLPASTFKIPNSIIALETGVVENDSTIFKWNGEKRRVANWEQDLTFRDAFHFSCVPCYQEVARKIGLKNMTAYLEKLGYGNMKVDSASIDLFWLEGESQINQFQQIDFLKRLYQSELPISERTEAIIKRMMVIEENNDYKLSGKTGWSFRNGKDNGWFVGYIETRAKIYFFAVNIEPGQQFDLETFPMIRKELTFKAFEHLKIVP